MQGEVISFHLFDVGGSFDMARLQAAAQGRAPQPAPTVGKGTPPYVEFPRPIVLTAPSLALEGDWGRTDAEVRLHLFPLGAVSVRIRGNVTPSSLARLHGWDQTRATIDGRTVPLEEAARLLFERERGLWEPAIRDRYTTNVLSETYTVFAFSDVGSTAAGFLDRHARDVAGLLVGENGARLHEKEVRDALKRWFSYYADDVIVVDWDAAFILDPSPAYEDLLFVLEIANLQLLEFRAYDDYLDDAIARGYDELEVLYKRALFKSARHTAHELSLLRMEIAELADEADNITKFLGDWFLARVYAAAQEKIHLPEWRAAVDEKLQVLHGLYQLASTESDSQRNLVLEVLIVLLFVLDVVLLFIR